MDIDLLQDPGKGVMMRQIFQIREKSTQIGHKHRAGHLTGCFTPRRHLKSKAQNPVDRVPRILNLIESLQQNR